MGRAWLFAARDLAILALTLLLWWLERSAASDASRGHTVLAVLTGLLTALCGFLLHEWGHLVGALLTGSRVGFPARLYSLFLFRFDVVHNGRTQFLAMSYGGYLASAVSVWLLVWLLPRDALSGQVGLGVGVLGVLATVLLEVPTTVRVYRGGPLPAQGVVYISDKE